MNALKTGLTGQTILLPGDDLAADQHIARLRDEYEPATDREMILVQSIADTDWRLLRIRICRPFRRSSQSHRPRRHDSGAYKGKADLPLLTALGSSVNRRKRHEREKRAVTNSFSTTK